MPIKTRKKTSVKTLPKQRAYIDYDNAPLLNQDEREERRLKAIIQRAADKRAGIKGHGEAGRQYREQKKKEATARAKTQAFKGRKSFDIFFKTEADCRVFFEKIRWKNGKKCPFCGCAHVWEFKNGGINKCSACLKKFNVKTGFFFERSRLPLKDWLTVIYSEVTFSTGITAECLAKELELNIKTVRRMLRWVRQSAFNQNIFKIGAGSAKTVVQMDHVEFGGSWVNLQKDKRNNKYKNNKIGALGVYEENGCARMFQVKDREFKTTESVLSTFMPEKATYYTDGAAGFKSLALTNELYQCNHSKHIFVNGQCTTNGIENVNRLVKRFLNVLNGKIPKGTFGTLINSPIFRYNTRFLTTLEKIVLALINVFYDTSNNVNIMYSDDFKELCNSF